MQQPDQPVLSGPQVADPQNPNPGTPTNPNPVTPPVSKTGTSAQSFCSGFFGASCGFIAGPAINIGRHTATNASVEGGVVRVNSDRDQTLGMIGYINHKIPIGKTGYFIGPYGGVGAPANGGDTFSYSVGALLTLPKGGVNQYGMAVGLGFLWSPGVQVLGDGVIDGKPLPEGETQIRYKTVTGSSLFVGLGVAF